MDKAKPQEISIDDILTSVSNVIKEKGSAHPDDSPCEELELTEVAEEGKPASNLDEAEQKIQDFVENPYNLKPEDKDYDITLVEEPSNIDEPESEPINPQIKEWLDANLPAIVKQIVSEEIKKQLADVNKNSK